MDHNQAFELVPLLALDALEDEEAREVQRHVESCSICAPELVRHQATAAALVPDEPAPEAGWTRLVAELPPREAQGPVTSTRRWGLGWIAAGLIAVLGAAVAYQTFSLNEVTGARGVVVAAEAAAGEEGAIVAEFTTEEGSVARVVLTRDGEGFVVPTDLEALGEDRTYQLWVVTPDDLVISAGVIGSDPQPARFTWIGDVAGFALTREVAGGVVSSAGDVVALIDL